MGIARPVMDHFPYAWAFFIPFILVATFTMLNLFIAIIVNAMETYSDNEHQQTVQALEDTRQAIGDDVHAEILALRREVVEIKQLLTQRHESSD